MDWFLANIDFIAGLTGQHLIQSVVPLVLAVVFAVPLAQLARLNRTVGGVILTLSSILYTIPSLAMFVFLPLILGTSIISPVNVIVALTIYAVALLVRSTLDALESIDDGVRQAAVAMGFTPVRRFLTVDFPLSIPVLFAGLRVISVTNISLVSVGALIGVSSLGTLFTDGLFRSFPTEIAVGILITLVLALVMDLVLVALERLVTPWRRQAPAKGRTPGTVAVEAYRVGA
ncbi:MAG: ABC transporter, permease protein (cluster 13, osmolytes) [uncultured Arthrobacter sp.]|uniref:ABC transporter, permease protein (Cluster 13, osmolytes) n=1 Tax=uncultured Arthrobacter sp. TaxID=114050 RepID=A0A6J4IM77_9MICC|nr:ABC transporter permease [uncultured Arthrobacter sp.]RJU02779.1 ABC transporter permease [Arthrobacter frigidicola]CAA9256764.1 MAG: ABC transporter, permease protein (cluster 13, osmolytes) [uncultured Arthrobacter sp.]